MLLIFIDEFKKSRKNSEFYGLVAICINNASYGKFKSGFYSRLEELGWDRSVEIKGRYAFSSKKGDKTVSISDRLEFVEHLFDLSKSESGKYASAKVYYSMDIFDKGTLEMDMYSILLDRIINTMPKCPKKGNKNGKNNIGFFLDNNQAINTEKLSLQVEEVCSRRNYQLIERCFDVDSGNDTPGIIFADHVAYFIDHYINTSRFNERSSNRIKVLLEKFSNNTLSKKEREQFMHYILSLDKQEKSKNLLMSLKKMEYAK